ARRDQRLHQPVTLEVVERAFRRIDRDLVEVGRAEARLLRVQIGEQAALQQRVVCEVDAGDQVRRQEGRLFRLGKEVVDVSVQRHAADDLDRNLFLGDQLGGVEDVIGLFGGPCLVEHLNAEIPLGEVARVDGFEQVAAV